MLELSKVTVTEALLTLAWPCLYTNSSSECARTDDRFEMPITKHNASRMFDLPGGKRAF